MGNNKRIGKIALGSLLLAAFAATTIALPQQEASRPRPRPQGQVSRDARPPGGVDPEVMRQMNERCAVIGRANEAERRGDLAEAERLHREVGGPFGPDDPSLHRNLGRIYDKQGREREAFEEYRRFLVGEKGYWSSGQGDARMLARYGDLCLRHSTVEAAARAFAGAASSERRDPKGGEPDPEPRNGSLAALRSAAYTALGLSLIGGGDDRAGLRELDRAVATDPNDWIPRFYRARRYSIYGREAEAVREAAQAERLAPPARRELVLRMRCLCRIADPYGKLIPFERFFRPDPASIWRPGMKDEGPPTPPNVYPSGGAKSPRPGERP